MSLSRYRQYIVLLALCVCLLITGRTGSTQPLSTDQANQANQADQPPPLSLILPTATFHQALRSLLPLTLEQQKRNQNFQGTFAIDSISKLVIKNNVIFMQGKISGKNMAMNAHVGGKTIQIKLGKMTLPVSCDIAFRFEQQTKTLFLKPKFYKQASRYDPAAASLAPLLDSMSKEYDLPLDQLDPLVGHLGVTPFFVQLEPVAIQLIQNALVLQFHPHTGKLDVDDEDDDIQ
jgi:hypothetical protein